VVDSLFCCFDNVQRQILAHETTVVASTRVSTRITDQCVSAMTDINWLPTESHAKVRRSVTDFSVNIDFTTLSHFCRLLQCPYSARYNRTFIICIPHDLSAVWAIYSTDVTSVYFLMKTTLSQNVLDRSSSSFHCFFFWHIIDIWVWMINLVCVRYWRDKLYAVVRLFCVLTLRYRIDVTGRC